MKQGSRILDKNNQVWFSGRDVAYALGYENQQDAVSKHVDDEDKSKVLLSQIATPEFPIPNRGLTIINESGLYSLVLSSQLPSAKQFGHFVWRVVAC